MAATRRSGEGSTAAPLPSFEDLLRAEQRAVLTDEAKRLRWVLDGPLTTAITVLREPFHDPHNAPEPYCTGSQGDDTTWHAVSKAPYTDPKVSSVTVSVSQIDDWEDTWREQHLGCADPPDGEDGDEEDDNYDFPSVCCGERRPHPQEMTLVVKASRKFVTVHDFVSAVHPWLMRKHDDLVAALSVLNGEPLSLPAGEHLMVTHGGPADLSVGTLDEWLRNNTVESYLLYRGTPVETDPWSLPPGTVFGPPPGYTGPWPPPYTGALTLNLEHLGAYNFSDGIPEQQPPS